MFTKWQPAILEKVPKYYLPPNLRQNGGFAGGWGIISGGLGHFSS
jgi:hypothetical protein